MTGRPSPFFCSWSGGKDSALALYQFMQAAGQPQCLLTMMAEAGRHSRSHGLPFPFLQKQARAIGASLLVRATTWAEYEVKFLSALGELKKQGIREGVFGDIDIAAHREWVERVCSLTGIKPHFPLWQKPRRSLLEELIRLGFIATIIVVKKDVLDPRFLGRTISPELITELEATGIDAAGENGEYHTAITAGPIFPQPIPFRVVKKFRFNDYWSLEIE